MTLLLFGRIYLWRNYPYQRDGSIKSRWFVCLGSRSDGIYRYLILPTTTTQAYHYDPLDGNRRNHRAVFLFSAGKYGFTKNCLLDLDLPFSDMLYSMDQLSPFLHDITETGVLDKTDLRRIYELVLISRSIPLTEKRQIHTNFNMNGMTGLPSPKRQTGARHKKR